MARGWKAEEATETFSHDLDALLAEAKDNGLIVSAKVAKDIGHLNHVHDNFLDLPRV